MEMAPPLTLRRSSECPAALAIQGLRGKGFVQLPQVDVLHLQAVARQQLGHGKHRADAHLVGLAAGHGKAAESAQRLQAQALGGRASISTQARSRRTAARHCRR
jgi:hypothetical protein